MEHDFAGKVAIVTGASSGLGAATARLLAESGANVVLTGRDKERLAANQGSVVAAGGHAVAIACDLEEDRSFDQIAQTALDAYGVIDILVHAGAHFAIGDVATIRPEIIDRLLRVNVRAPIMLTRAIVPHLTAQSSIVFVSSTGAHLGFAGRTVYTATKGAVEVFSRSLAIELAPRTRVNVIAPGFINTPMFEAQCKDNPDLESWVVESTPTRFVATAEDVAASILMLTDNEASRYITGTTLICDGGWVAKG